MAVQCVFFFFFYGTGAAAVLPDIIWHGTCFLKIHTTRSKRLVIV